MNTTAYIATSLDGMIADSDGGVDWLHELPNPDQSDYGFAEFMEGMDAILMGRKTFEVVQSFGEWPYTKPVYVLSHHLKEIPAGYEGRIQLVKGPIREVVWQIEQEAGPNLYVDGGTVIQHCLTSNCLSRLVITTVPILLGKGIPLFAPSDRRVPLQHVQTEILGPGLVKSTYDVLNAKRHG